MPVIVGSRSRLKERRSSFNHAVPPGAVEKRRDELLHRIRKAVAGATNHKVHELDVVCEGGEFHLSGYCRTFYTKQVAQKTAMDILGNESLVNDICVVYVK